MAKDGSAKEDMHDWKVTDDITARATDTEAFLRVCLQCSSRPIARCLLAGKDLDFLTPPFAGPRAA